MKMYLIIISVVIVIFILIQLYITMSTNKTETQAYTVIKVEKDFEIRHYPIATLAMIHSKASTYRELGSTGFRTLAGYIFGGNEAKKQIPMTSPVHMTMADSNSSMAFVLPKEYNETNLPKPNDSSISFVKSVPEYVAVIRFGGFASTESIHQHQILLEQSLKAKGLTHDGNFRFLGYNPPYQLVGRRNEVIVAINWENE